MSLDKESRSRDYLYGRLLAVADVAEASTYTKRRAVQLMPNAFSRRFQIILIRRGMLYIRVCDLILTEWAEVEAFAMNVR